MVIVSDTIGGLQCMINNFNKYCETWNLEVNLGKSKILKKGGGKFVRKKSGFVKVNA
jgi:hypothetical protein